MRVFETYAVPFTQLEIVKYHKNVCFAKTQIKPLIAFLFEEIQIFMILRKAVEKAKKTTAKYKTVGNLNQY